MGVNWFENHENVIEVIRWAYRHEHAKTAGDVLYMLEKPWKFGWIWNRIYRPPQVTDLWEESVGSENPDDWAPTDVLLATDPGWIDP